MEKNIIEINTRVILADSTLKSNPKKLLLIFAGTYATYFRNPGLSFSLEGKLDVQELDLLMEITGVMGEGWQSQLVDKEVRLLVDVATIDRSDTRVAVKAIGHKVEEDGDDDYFLVLNSNCQLVSKATAMKLITEEN